MIAGAAGQHARLVALLYVAFFFVAGIHLAYFPVWLDGRGLSPAEVSIVLAVPQIARILISPAVSMAADHLERPRLVLTLASAGALAACLGLMPSLTMPSVLVLAGLGLCFFLSTMPLIDALAIEGGRRFGLDYGRMRLWGSWSFIVATLAGGSAVEAMGAESALWLVIAGLVALVAVGGSAIVMSTRAGGENVARTKRPAAGGRWWQALDLLARPEFLLLVATSSVIQAAHAAYYAFGTLHWTGLGHGTTVIGLLWSIGVLSEIVFFALAGRLLPGWSAAGLLMVGGLAAMVRWPLTALDPPLAVLAVLQVLHGLTFGAAHLGVIRLMAVMVAPGRSATAQALHGTMAGGVVMGAAIWISGGLYESLGSGAFAIMGLLGCVGAALAVLLGRLVNERAEQRIDCRGDDSAT